MTDADDRKGHRHRLRERFAADGGAAMPDYELLELLLFQMLPRRDTKPIAKRLIDRFGSLAAVLAADAENIAKIRDSGPAVASYLKAIHQAGRRMAREGLRTRKELGSWDMVLDYCRAELGHLTRESFHVLFLDQKNGLLTAKEQSRGTVDQTSVYPPIPRPAMRTSKLHVLSMPRHKHLVLLCMTMRSLHATHIGVCAQMD